jgi:RHS repeat-associated protein
VIAERTPGGGRTDYGADALGSVTATAAAGGTASSRYSPYGEQSAAPAGATLGWVGCWGYRPTARSVASHYVRARHYASKQGQWTTVDPLWPSERHYAYASDRPSLETDRRGTQAVRSRGPSLRDRLVPLCIGPVPNSSLVRPRHPDYECYRQSCEWFDKTYKRLKTQQAERCGGATSEYRNPIPCRITNSLYEPCTKGHRYWQECGEEIRSENSEDGDANKSHYPAPKAQFHIGPFGTDVLLGEYCCVECRVRYCCHVVKPQVERYYEQLRDSFCLCHFDPKRPTRKCPWESWPRNTLGTP